MLLSIDYREKQIIDLIKNRDDIDINTEVKNLPVADFVFSNDQSDILLLVERKTYNDLESSIKDGRFREQKSRLIESIGDPKKILYIIEGHNLNRNDNMIFGSILNMIYKHDFKILFSKSHEETVTLLLLIYKKLKNGDICNENSPQEIISAPLKLKSKGDNIKKQLFQCILTVIPGVSMTTANKIVEIYPTLKELMDTYNKLEDDKMKENLLASINLGSRKLGRVLSCKIWKTFYFNSVE